jgi:hypothetical protein
MEDKWPTLPENFAQCQETKHLLKTVQQPRFINENDRINWTEVKSKRKDRLGAFSVWEAKISTNEDDDDEEDEM